MSETTERPVEVRDQGDFDWRTQQLIQILSVCLFLTQDRKIRVTLDEIARCDGMRLVIRMDPKGGYNVELEGQGAPLHA